MSQDNAIEWRGWNEFDNNSHAVIEGKTVCGVHLKYNVPLVFDTITACLECREILAKKKNERKATN